MFNIFGKNKESDNMTNKSMFNIYKEEIEWGGRSLSLETGKIARQANGSVVATYGATVVHATVVAAKECAPGQDFFPLTVNYQEKMYAAGRIPPSFFRREGKPSEREVLISRLIDRPIRPLFPETFRNETQVVCTVLSHDKKNDSDIVAIIAASAALKISGIPFLGPIGAACVGYVNGEYVLNPVLQDADKSDLKLTVAGTNEGVLMVESEAKELSEEVMLKAVNFGFEAFQPVIKMINDLAKNAGKDAWQVPEMPAEYSELKEAFSRLIGEDLKEAFKIKEKLARQDKVAELHKKAIESIEITEENALKIKLAGQVLNDMDKDIVRGNILDTGIRIDGRDTKTVRPICCEVGVLPETHGSALFTRGETQALVVTTLGSGESEQLLDNLASEDKNSYMLHYNFPPFSVGEVGRYMGPGRREIGHGKLAWRATHPLLPSKDDFPYTIRVVSEIMESNGSSSMATVCGTSLSLMDAGVPIPRPISGIAMGLIKEKDGRVAILTDILGDEDHLGDMDFKVAGTENGITALQMDIKITSITKEIMEKALNQAHDGRMHILGEMSKAIKEARAELNANAPKISSLYVPKDKIKDVIGSGGKVIKEIVEVTGCKIDIEEDGFVKIFSPDSEATKKAQEWILGIVSDAEVGKIYKGKVSKILDFGAVVTFMANKEGLVHISEISKERVKTVDDVLKERQEVYVKCIDFDNVTGKVRLSMKRVDQETGKDLES